MTKEKRQNILIVLGLIVLIGIIGGVTYSFFSYSRTGSANTLSVGNIEFTSSYDSVDITGVFPIAKTAVNTDTDNVISVDVDIEGATTYEHGIYYEVTADDVHLTVNGKNVPIGIKVTSSNLSNVTLTDYEDGKILTDGSLFAKGRILASTGNTDNSVDGTVTIKAYLDTSKIAITDSLENGAVNVSGYTNGTGNGWVNGRVVLTTSEWNSLANTPLSFKVKVEAYENDVSTLVDGVTFNKKIKKLSGTITDAYEAYSRQQCEEMYEMYEELSTEELEMYFGVSSYEELLQVGINEFLIGANDANITSFQRVTEIPDIEEFTEGNIISTENSAYPIYAWYDNGIIKYYSESNNIKTNSSMTSMFKSLEVLTSIGDLSNLDTTNVIYMSRMFEGCVSLSNITGLSNWNVSNVASMVAMFSGCQSLTNLNNMSNWNVFNVTGMQSMFKKCTSLSDASGINDWNINVVTNFVSMFKDTPVHPTFSKRAGTWNAQGTFTPSA